MGRGIFAARQLVLSCAKGSGNVARALSFFSRFLGSQYMVDSVTINHLIPPALWGGPGSDLLCARLARVLPSFNLVHILLEHNR